MRQFIVLGNSANLSQKMVNLYYPDTLVTERVTWKMNIKLPDCWLIPIRPPKDEVDTVEIEKLQLPQPATQIE